MILLSRTVIVTPEQAVTSVTQTASSTRLDAGCQMGELRLGMICSAAANSIGCSRISGLPGSLPIFGDSLAVSWCFGSERLAATEGDFNGRFADPLTVFPGRVTKRRAIPRGPCFRRFFAAGGGCAGDSAVGGSGTGLTEARATGGLSALTVDDDGRFADSAADRESCSCSIRRFSVSGSGGRPRGRFTPSILTFFACHTPVPHVKNSLPCLILRCTHTNTNEFGCNRRNAFV